jgi:hypothetical protein
MRFLFYQLLSKSFLTPPAAFICNGLAFLKISFMVLKVVPFGLFFSILKNPVDDFTNTF